MPLPLDCKVRYVDIFDTSQLIDNFYEGQAVSDILEPDIVATFEDLTPIAPRSIDFVVACHVIEHTTDPIGAISRAWTKLRPGGSIVLVIPEITRTFDRSRELTSLEHLVKDFRDEAGRRERDKLHFQEFYLKAFETPVNAYEGLWQEKWADAYPIHYHTWTHDSFMKMVAWMNAEGCLPTLDEVWSCPPLSDPNECIEFWVSLRKSH